MSYHQNNISIPAAVLRENALKKARTSIGIPAAVPADDVGFNITTTNIDQSQTQTQQAPQLVQQYVYQNCLFSEFTFNGNMFLAADPKRVYLLIQNNSGANMYYSSSQSGTFTAGLIIRDTLAWEPTVAPTNQVAISGVGIGFLISGTRL